MRERRILRMPALRAIALNSSNSRLQRGAEVMLAMAEGRLFCYDLHTNDFWGSEIFH